MLLQAASSTWPRSWPNSPVTSSGNAPVKRTQPDSALALQRAFARPDQGPMRAPNPTAAKPRRSPPPSLRHPPLPGSPPAPTARHSGHWRSPPAPARTGGPTAGSCSGSPPRDRLLERDLDDLAFRPPHHRTSSSAWGRRVMPLVPPSIVIMAGLVPAIHVFDVISRFKAWMPGTRPGMTRQRL